MYYKIADRLIESTMADCLDGHTKYVAVLTPDEWKKDQANFRMGIEMDVVVSIEVSDDRIIKRMGGSNHADIEPATPEDTEKLLKISGGEFSWDSQAVILYSEGKYVACAINTMPHGRQTIDDNNYEGQFCLHMNNSRTHGSDSINDSHQKTIEKAYSWAH